MTSTTHQAILAAVLVLASGVRAHGTVSGVVAGGNWYSGYNANFQWRNPIPVVPAWTANTLDNGFVDNYASPDIICHKVATAGGSYVTVAAGSTVELQWTPWPESHHGPVLDYLASCRGDCQTVDKTTLLFNKINEGGLISGSNPGRWASDELITRNNSWTVTIPASIAPGKYVLRHEIIALHSAGSLNGAQNYPSCFNLEVTGSGTNNLATGTLGTQLYNAQDPGLLFNLYRTFSSYIIPGPPLLSGGGSGNPPPASSSQATSTPTPSPTPSPTPTPSQSSSTPPTPPAPSSSSSPVSFSSTVTGRIGKPTKFTCYVDEEL
ncbi:hypothetical protein B0A52_09647 [Exophiala mesophila]|uniref:Auxiliary Activity family 9 catalytic domain-containing protein n=1 Tax=Exophiala mesophila TaxID=212818 RepID=A0A438MS10_EXOME|nr:hypothetical protein B0A52_09647 [Exophiala mesophila]